MEDFISFTKNGTTCTRTSPAPFTPSTTWLIVGAIIAATSIPTVVSVVIGTTATVPTVVVVVTIVGT